jgi:thioesterase domain-containing protein
VHGNQLRLRASEDSRAVVFVHPASGSAAAFRKLEPLLGPVGSVYAFHSPDPMVDRPDSIEGLAAAYLSEFRAAAPN